MREFLRMIDGRKTHIGVIALTTFALLASFDVAVPPWLWALVSGWTGVAVTHKANKGIAAVRDAARVARDSVSAVKATTREVAGLRYENFAPKGGNGQAKS